VVKPTVQVLACSACSSGLPPVSTAHCPDGHWGMTPYCAAVTPVFWHCARVAGWVAPAAQGSSETWLVLVTDWGVNSSRMFGARIALLYEARRVKPPIGVHSPPTL